eukprot:441982_1
MTQGGDFDYKQFRKDWDNLLERQKYKEAEKLCHEGLAKSPLDQSRGRLYNHLGYLYENFLDDKTFDDILEHYVLSLQVDESNANSHYNLANFLLEQGMQHLLRALELNPNHNKANKRYANLTPIKANTTLDLGGHKYQVIEVVEDGVRAVRLRKRNDGGYERSDDEPVYVEVSSPEKVYPSNNKNNRKTGGGGRTSNMGANNSNQPMALNIDDPNNYDNEQYDNNNNNNNNNNGCCYKCIFYSWFWCILWLIALAAIITPVLAYFQIFGTDECMDKIIINEIPLNIDQDTQGNLNILFVMNCDSSDWNEQFIAADKLLQEYITNNKGIVKYDIMQYCNLGNNNATTHNFNPLCGTYLALYGTYLALNGTYLASCSSAYQPAYQPTIITFRYTINTDDSTPITQSLATNKTYLCNIPSLWFSNNPSNSVIVKIVNSKFEYNKYKNCVYGNYDMNVNEEIDMNGFMNTYYMTNYYIISRLKVLMDNLSIGCGGKNTERWLYNILTAVSGHGQTLHTRISFNISFSYACLGGTPWVTASIIRCKDVSFNIKSSVYGS